MLRIAFRDAVRDAVKTFLKLKLGLLFSGKWLDS